MTRPISHCFLSWEKYGWR